MTDTYIDGGGVIDDAPLPAGTRIRFSPTDNPDDDIQVFVGGGKLHVVGMWDLIAVEPLAANRVLIRSVRPSE